MANSPRNSVGNVRSDMDIAYPEHLSRLHRHSVLADYPKSYYNPKRNTRSRRGIRYRTQPVTFGEIQEVDEENTVIDNQSSDDQVLSMSASLSTSKLELELYKFSKSLGAKIKNPIIADDNVVTSAAMKNPDQSNGTETEEQTSWTDYAREGSV